MIRITGYVNYYGEGVTCTNCLASINVGPSIYGQREGVVCGTCEEPLGIEADHRAALCEQHGMDLLAEEQRWFVEQDHAEALAMHASMTPGASQGPQDEPLPNTWGRWTVFLAGGLWDSMTGYGATWAYATAKGRSEVEWMKGHEVRVTCRPEDGVLREHAWMV
jgi:hypothetical protein